MPLSKQSKNYKGLKENEIKTIESPSWGASLHWIYLLGMRSFWQAILIFILLLIPAVNIVALIVVIFTGKKLAWENRHWSSFSEFLSVQKVWDKTAKILWSIMGILLIVGVTTSYYTDYKNSHPKTTVGQFAISVSEMEKINDQDTRKYEKLFGSYIPDGFSVYAFKILVSNTSSQDAKFNNYWIYSDQASENNIPSRYSDYIKMKYDIYPTVGTNENSKTYTIKSGEGYNLVRLFLIDDNKNNLNIVIKPYSDTQGELNILLPK